LSSQIVYRKGGRGRKKNASRENVTGNKRIDTEMRESFQIPQLSQKTTKMRKKNSRGKVEYSGRRIHDCRAQQERRKRLVFTRRRAARSKRKTQATQLSTTDERTESPNEIEGRDDVITYGPNLSPNLGFLNSSFSPFFTGPPPTPLSPSPYLVLPQVAW
jgi:hypothetical protein